MAGESPVGGFFQPAFQRLPVAFPGLPKQPAYCLLDQVVRVVQQDVGNGKRVVQLFVADKSHGRNHADALLPKRPTLAGQVVKQRPVFVHQPFAQQGIAAQVHQVPVVDAVRMRQVEVDATLPEGSVFPRMSENLHQRQQGRQPHLVILGSDAALQEGPVGLLPACFYDGPRYGNLDSQELVALAVLAGAGFEESAQARDLRRIGRREHGII